MRMRSKLSSMSTRSMLAQGGIRIYIYAILISLSLSFCCKQNSYSEEIDFDTTLASSVVRLSGNFSSFSGFADTLKLFEKELIQKHEEKDIGFAYKLEIVERISDSLIYIPRNKSDTINHLISTCYYFNNPSVEMSLVLAYEALTILFPEKEKDKGIEFYSKLLEYRRGEMPLHEMIKYVDAIDVELFDKYLMRIVSICIVC